MPALSSRMAVPIPENPAPTMTISWSGTVIGPPSTWWYEFKPPRGLCTFSRMASTDAGHAGFSSVTNPQRLTRALWLAAVAVAACYGVFLFVIGLRQPSGAELAGQFWLQPAVKATPAV